MPAIANSRRLLNNRNSVTSTVVVDDRWLVKSPPSSIITAKEEESIGLMNNTVSDNQPTSLHAPSVVGFDVNGTIIPPTSVSNMTGAKISSDEPNFANFGENPTMPILTPANEAVSDVAETSEMTASQLPGSTSQQTDLESHHRQKLYESMRRIRHLQVRREQCQRDMFNLETMYLENPTFVGNIVDGYDLTSMLAKAQRLHQAESILTNSTSRENPQNLQQSLQQPEIIPAADLTSSAESRMQFVNTFGNAVILPDEQSQQQRSRSPVIRDTDRIFSASNPNFNQQVRKWNKNVDLYRSGKLAGVLAAQFAAPSGVKNETDEPKNRDKSQKSIKDAAKRALSKKTADAGQLKRSAPNNATSFEDEMPAKKKKKTKSNSESKTLPLNPVERAAAVISNRKKSSLSHSFSTTGQANASSAGLTAPLARTSSMRVQPGEALTGLKLEDDEETTAELLRNDDADLFLNSFNISTTDTAEGSSDSIVAAPTRRRKNKNRKIVDEEASVSPSDLNTNTNHSSTTTMTNSFEEVDDVNADADYNFNEDGTEATHTAGGGGKSSGKKKKKKKTKKKDKKDSDFLEKSMFLSERKPSGSKSTSKAANSGAKSSHSAATIVGGGSSKHASGKSSKKSLESNHFSTASMKSTGSAKFNATTASPQPSIIPSKSTKKLPLHPSSNLAALPSSSAKNSTGSKTKHLPATAASQMPVLSAVLSAGRKLAPSSVTTTPVLMNALTSSRMSTTSSAATQPPPQTVLREFLTPTIQMPTIHSKRAPVPASATTTSIMTKSGATNSVAAVAAAKTNGQRKNSIPSSGSGNQSVIINKNARPASVTASTANNRQNSAATKYSVVTTNHNPPAPAMPLIALGTRNQTAANASSSASAAAASRRAATGMLSNHLTANTTNNNRSEIANALLSNSKKVANFASQNATRQHQSQQHVFAVPRPATTTTTPSTSTSMPPILPPPSSYTKTKSSEMNYAASNRNSTAESSIFPPLADQQHAATPSPTLTRRLSNSFSPVTSASPSISSLSHPAVNSNSSNILGIGVVAYDSDSNDSSDTTGSGTTPEGRRTRGRPRRGNILDIAAERIRQRDG